MLKRLLLYSLFNSYMFRWKQFIISSLRLSSHSRRWWARELTEESTPVPCSVIIPFLGVLYRLQWLPQRSSLFGVSVSKRTSYKFQGKVSGSLPTDETSGQDNDSVVLPLRVRVLCTDVGGEGNRHYQLRGSINGPYEDTYLGRRPVKLGNS